VAAALGVTLRTYRKYESGTPPYSSIPIICFGRKKFRVNLDWLLSGKDVVGVAVGGASASSGARS